MTEEQRERVSGEAFQNVRILLSWLLAGKQAGRLCFTLGKSSILGKGTWLLFLICLIGMLISFQLTSLVEIKCCTRFSGFLLVQMKSLLSFSHSAILFGLLLGALAAIPPVTAVVDLSYSLPLDCKLLQVTAWFTPLRMVQRTGA